MKYDESLSLLTQAPAGTAFFGMAEPYGDGDVAPFPAFFVKVNRGEAHSNAIGEKPFIHSQSSVMKAGNVALVPFAFRMGNYPRVFLAWLNHFESPSALDVLRKVERYTILVFENKPKPARSIRAGNNPKFWETILAHVRGFDPWTVDEFSDSVDAEMEKTTPEGLYREMKARNEASF